MDDILAKHNRHLFLEKKTNTTNSFIANVNFLVNKFSDIKDINSKFTASDIAAIRALLDALGSPTPPDNPSSLPDLGAILKDLLKGSLNGCRKLDIDLLKNFANYSDDLSDEEKRILWSDVNSQVSYSSVRVYFRDKTYIEKEFSSLVFNHHQLRDELNNWEELSAKFGGTGIEIVPNQPIYNHELLRIWDTTLEGSTIEYIKLYVAEKEQCSSYSASFRGAKDAAPEYSWMDTTSALAVAAYMIPTLLRDVETASVKAAEASAIALQAESYVAEIGDARDEARSSAQRAILAERNAQSSAESLASDLEALRGRLSDMEALGGEMSTLVRQARESASEASEKASMVDTYATNAARVVLEKVQAGIITARYEDYPEFLQAYLDLDGKFLFGIRIDGTVEWAEGIPQPIKDAIKQIGYIDNTDKTYIRKYEDSEGNVLFGIKTDGSVDWPLGVPQGIKNYLEEHYGKIENDNVFHEYLQVYTDKENNFIFGIKKDGSINWVKGTPDGIKEYLNTIYGYQESNVYTDYIKTFTDLNGQILFGIKKDGSIEWSVGVPTAIKEYFSSFMYRDHEGNMDLASIHDIEGNVLEATDYKGKKVFYRDVLIDGDLKVTGDIKGVDKIKGVHNWSKSKDLLHIPIPECAVVKITGFSRPVNKIDMHNCKMEFWDMRGNYFEKKIALGLQGNSTWNLPKPNYKFDMFADDWDDDEFMIKFGDWVAQDSFHLKAFYTDFLCGRAIVTYQWWQEICKTRGILADTTWKQALLNEDNVPVNMPAIDTLNFINALEDDVDDLRKGKLDLEDYIGYRLDSGAKCVPDGFPCIVYINERFHGIFSWQLKKNKDNYHLRKNNACHIHIDGFTRPETLWMGNVQWRGEELRYPKDLFCEDGTMYDGDLNMNEIMGTDSPLYSDIVNNYENYFDSSVKYWKDIRKKKGKPAYNEKYDEMIAEGATKADAKAAAQIAQTEAEKKAVKKTRNITAQAKASVIRLSHAIPSLIVLDEAYDADPTPENYQAVRTEFEKYFYPDNLIDYNILVDLDGDGDSVTNNCQWVTWDGNIWFANVYDCNGTFGGNGMGNSGLLYDHRIISAFQAKSNQHPYFYTIKYYAEETEARYAQLRRLGLLDPDYIFGKINDWVKRIGVEYYLQEFETWYLQPSINSAIINDQYWELMRDENNNPITGDHNTYKPETNYEIGDEVYSPFCRVYRNAFQTYSGSAGIYKFKCIKPNRGIYCFRNNSLADNIWHLYKWYKAQLAIMDGVYNFSN